MADELQAAALLEQRGLRSDAERRYRELLDHRPDWAVARFNYACFLRRGGRLEEALAEHRRALELGIDQPEEVHSNIGVICNELRRDADARASFEQALALDPEYIPALYNLALLREEFGEREAALGMFHAILELNPAYHDALVRIAYAKRITDPADPVVRKLRRQLRRSHVDELARESLHFALGKALDDCGLHDEAFLQYEAGNRLGAKRLLPYDRAAEEARIGQIIETFTAARLATLAPVSERPLLFITGMFRSGSTLFEQLLAAHPEITAGGEIDYFGRELAGAGRAFPDSIAALDAAGWQRLGSGYLDYLDRTFPGGGIVTNKRPDAFEWLGLLKSMYPNARFVNTVRHPLDTCLSIYFQQLDGRIGYACDLANIGHRHRQYQRLMQHWSGQFGASIFDADYDAFVADPRPVAQNLLRFLGLPWHEDCLGFQRLRTRVRTASIWQVRDSVYASSSGRWRNYERQLEPARRQLGQPSA